jgi:hypothetical protein
LQIGWDLPMSMTERWKPNRVEYLR